MLLNLPIVYHGKFLHAKRNEWVSRIFVKPEMFEIAEMDSEFVVAARHSDKSEILWHNDGLWICEYQEYWEKKENDAGFDPHDKRDLSVLTGGSVFRLHSIGCYGIPYQTVREKWSKWVNGDPVTMPVGTYSDFRDITLDKERARMTAMLDDIRLVDGVLYRRLAMPKYNIDEDGVAWITTDLETAAGGTFSLNRKADMDDYLEAHFDTRARESHTVSQPPLILIPEAFAFDDEQASMDNTIQRALKHAHKICGMGKSARGLIRARLDLAWETYSESGRESDFDLFLGEMGAFGEFCSKLEMTNPDRQAETRGIGRCIAAAISRWEIRPIKASENSDETNPLPMP